MGIEKVRDIIGEVVYSGFYIFLDIVRAAILCFTLLGSVASLYLLYLLFPVEAMILSEATLPVFKIFFTVCKYLLIAVCLLGYVWLCLYFVELIKELKKKRKKNRDKFIRDLVKEMKRSKR